MDQHFDSIANYFEIFWMLSSKLCETDLFEMCYGDPNIQYLYWRFPKIMRKKFMSTQSYSEIENCYVCIQNTNLRDLVSVYKKKSIRQNCSMILCKDPSTEILLQNFAVLFIWKEFGSRYTNFTNWWLFLGHDRTVNRGPSDSSSSRTGRSRACPSQGRASSTSSVRYTRPRNSSDRRGPSASTAGQLMLHIHRGNTA